MKPTKEQIQWFWEQCGFELHKATDGNLHWFDQGRNTVSPIDGDTGLLIIDLDNLFKYGREPAKLESVHFSWGDKGVLCWLYTKRKIGRLFCGEGLTEEDAFFEAIYKALGDK